MSSALPGVHLCLKHQGNHSHYASENCLVCKMASIITELLEREGAEGFEHALKNKARLALSEAMGSPVLPVRQNKLHKYIVATAVGGWTGQPEVTYENHDTIEAKNEKEAVEIYNKTHKCNYCYGHVLSQVKDPT